MNSNKLEEKNEKIRKIFIARKIVGQQFLLFIQFYKLQAVNT